MKQKEKNDATSEIVGTWKICNTTKSRLIEIYNNPGQKFYRGKLIGFLSAKENLKVNYGERVSDDHPPVPGQDILQMEYYPDKKSGVGKLQDLLSGKMYRCSSVLDSHSSLYVTKYLQSEFIRHIEVWKRINN